jgi:hypothetical protein
LIAGYEQDSTHQGCCDDVLSPWVGEIRRSRGVGVGVGAGVGWMYRAIQFITAWYIGMHVNLSIFVIERSSKTMPLPPFQHTIDGERIVITSYH